MDVCIRRRLFSIACKPVQTGLYLDRIKKGKIENEVDRNYRNDDG